MHMGTLIGLMRSVEKGRFEVEREIWWGLRGARESWREEVGIDMIDLHRYDESGICDYAKHMHTNIHPYNIYQHTNMHTNNNVYTFKMVCNEYQVGIERCFCG